MAIAQSPNNNSRKKNRRTDNNDNTTTPNNTLNTSERKKNSIGITQLQKLVVPNKRAERTTEIHSKINSLNQK